MLYCLDRMANHGTLTIAQPRILFSITTQGPIHKLYAHWTADEDDVRVFRSRLWDSWNALVLKRATDFLVTLNNVCRWGTGPFLQTVVDSLRAVERIADTES
jgi:hypothetical protein